MVSYVTREKICISLESGKSPLPVLQTLICKFKLHRYMLKIYLHGGLVVLRGERTGITGSIRRNMMGENRFRDGPSGLCVCPKCGNVLPHSKGIPCSSQFCAKCKAIMIRVEK